MNIWAWVGVATPVCTSFLIAQDAVKEVVRKGSRTMAKCSESTLLSCLIQAQNCKDSESSELNLEFQVTMMVCLLRKRDVKYFT